jgi:hypothetical protein
VTEAPPASGTADVVWVQAHRALQFLADRLPDEAAAAARRALACEDPQSAAARAAEVMAFALRQGRIPTTDLELTVLEECLLAGGRDTSALDEIPEWVHPRPDAFCFDAGSPEVVASDAAVLRAVVACPGVLAVWRAWRRSAIGAPWPPPTPLYLVETSDAATLRDVVRAVYGPGTVDPGPTGPVVEPYLSGYALPDLYLQAQQSARLVHVAVPAPDLLLADLFDGLPDPDGRPQELVSVSPEEAEALLERLANGRLVLTIEHCAEDVVDPAAGLVVPLHLMTDGRWVWSQATVYYLHRYLVAPPHDFHAYLCEQAWPSPPSDAVVALAAQWVRRDATHLPVGGES